MKISFMTFACPTWSFDQVLDAATAIGYHGIEFRCDANHRHGVEISAPKDERLAFRDRLEGAAVEPCCLATSLRFVADDVLGDVPDRLELAVDLGCPALRVFCGKPPDDMGRSEMIAIAASHLRDAAEMAAQHDLELWLETHDAICRAADAVAIVRQADHPAVAINWDNMHPLRAGESLDATIAQITGLIRHTHFHDAPADPEQFIITPLDQGGMPMDDMFQALIRMGFDGYLSGEWFDDQYGPTPEEAIAQYHSDMTRLAQRNHITLG